MNLIEELFNYLVGDVPADGESPAVKSKPVKVRANPAIAQRNGQIVVRPDTRALWKIKNWRQTGNTLLGTYKTAAGAYSGKVILNGDYPSYYILQPPAALLQGPHRYCFRPRADGWYWVHFQLASPDIDSGIMAIEGLLYDAITGRA